MNCCINCFESNYIKEIILGAKVIGACNYCGSKKVNVYDPSELNIFFKGIIELYEIDNDNGKDIVEQIIIDFQSKVFSSVIIESRCAKDLIIGIIKDDIGDYTEILNNPVRLKYRSTNIEEAINIPLAFSWDSFCYEIKNVNRFHFVNSLNLEKFKSIFRHFEKPILKGKKYFRARISDTEIGFKVEDMGNPPNYLAKAGRANPQGISYLYLASDINTTLYEARASLFDYVCIGTFRLEENIKVVNLSRLTYDVFRLAELESLEEVMIHSSFIDKLEQELSKPKRKGDSELDYLPTQYLSELIKSMGYDGIEYKSSLYEEGFNLAVFYPEKFKCLDVCMYDINDIKLDYTNLSTSERTSLI